MTSSNQKRLRDLEEKLTAMEAEIQPYRDRNAYLETALEVQAENFKPVLERIAALEAREAANTAAAAAAAAPPATGTGPAALPVAAGATPVVAPPKTIKARLVSLGKKTGVSAGIGGVIAAVASQVSTLQAPLLAATKMLGLETGVPGTYAVYLNPAVGPIVTGAIVVPLTVLAAYSAYKLATASLRLREPMWKGMKNLASNMIGTPAAWIGKQAKNYLLPAVQPNLPSVACAVGAAILALQYGTPVGPAIAGGYFGMKLVRKLWQKATGPNTTK